MAGAAVPALQPDQLAETAAGWRRDGVWKSFYVEQRAVVGELPKLAPGLASVGLPATILAGSHDRISPPAHAETLASELPHAELAIVDGVGHLLPQQRPDLVAKAISRLI